MSSKKDQDQNKPEAKDKRQTVLVCQKDTCKKECICDKLKEGPKSEEDQPQPEKKLELSIDAVNGFMNIIGVIMVNDVRGDSLITHFQNMLIQQNPDIKLNPAPAQE